MPAGAGRRRVRHSQDRDVTGNGSGGAGRGLPRRGEFESQRKSTIALPARSFTLSVACALSWHPQQHKGSAGADVATPVAAAAAESRQVTRAPGCQLRGLCQIECYLAVERPFHPLRLLHRPFLPAHSAPACPYARALAAHRCGAALCSAGAEPRLNPDNNMMIEEKQKPGDGQETPLPTQRRMSTIPKVGCERPHHAPRDSKRPRDTLRAVV